LGAPIPTHILQAFAINWHRIMAAGVDLETISPESQGEEMFNVMELR
jgi:hypothetical protein